jgi:transcription elongation factor/antiterminator RfaH
MSSARAASPEAAWWAAVNTQPHREQIALDNLQRQGFSTYCPVFRRRRSHARRVEEVLRPLFPGYLFVDVGTERDCWRPILSTYGVRTLVTCGGQPSLLDARFIDALRLREVDGVIARPPVPYRIGQQVQVVAGAFDGLVATILSLEEKDRLTVLLNMMSRQVKAHLDGAQVMPL